MGVCNWCGNAFPLTRSTRKYCTTRCKTNACLGRKPSRIRAAEVEAAWTNERKADLRPVSLKPLGAFQCRAV